MLNKKMMTLLGICLFLSSNGLWARCSQASGFDDEIRGKKSLVPVVSEISLSMPYCPGTEVPQRRRLSRDELLKQATLRSLNSLKESSKPVSLLVDEDEKPLARDLKSFFAQYDRSDA